MGDQHPGAVALGRAGEGIGDGPVRAVRHDADVRAAAGERAHHRGVVVALGDDEVRQAVGGPVHQAPEPGRVVGDGVVGGHHQAARERPQQGEEEELGRRLGRLHVDDLGRAAQAGGEGPADHPHPAAEPGRRDHRPTGAPAQAAGRSRPDLAHAGGLGDPAPQLVAGPGRQHGRQPGARQRVGQQVGVVPDAAAAGPLHDHVVARAAHGATTDSTSSSSDAPIASQP